MKETEPSDLGFPVPVPELLRDSLMPYVNTVARECGNTSRGRSLLLMPELVDVLVLSLAAAASAGAYEALKRREEFLSDKTVIDWIGGLSSWIETSYDLPNEGVSVMVWRPEYDRVKTGYWFAHKDVPPGQSWSIEGSSGGLGTKFAIKPPTHWMPLPAPPS